MPSRWITQVLRFTIFTASALPPEATAKLWHDIADGQPSVDENRPREGTRRQFGPYGDAQLEVQVLPMRVDLLLGPAVSEGQPVALHFGSLDVELARFADLVKGWLPKIPTEVVRLAIGVIALERATTRAASYGRIAELVPSVKLDPRESSDFFYQINRPRESEVLKGQKMNRLMKWSGIVIRTGMVSADGVRTALTTTNEEHFCRLELDISTPAEFHGPLRKESLAAIFEEMVTIATTLAEKGELA